MYFMHHYSFRNFLHTGCCDENDEFPPCLFLSVTDKTGTFFRIVFFVLAKAINFLRLVFFCEKLPTKLTNNKKLN